MKIRRRYHDRYLARGKYKGIQIQNSRHLTDRERARIERLSWHEMIAVLDPTTRLRDRFAISGCLAIDLRTAAALGVDKTLDTAVADAYHVALVADKGVWMPGADWFRLRGWERDPLPRVLLT